MDEQRARDIKHDAMIFGAGVWHHAQRMKPSKRWSGAYLLVIELGQLPVKRLIQELQYSAYSAAYSATCRTFS